MNDDPPRQADARCSNELFEYAPVPTWELDFSAIKRLLHDAGLASSAALEAQLAREPALIETCAQAMRVVDINRAAIALLGAATKQEAIAWHVRAFSLDSFHAFGAALLALMRGEPAPAVETWIYKVDGTICHLATYLAVLPSHEQTLERVIVSVVDITERKRMESALRASDERQRLALAVGKIGAFDADITTGSGTASPELAEIWGIRPGFDEGFVACCWSHIHPDDLARVQAEFEVALAARGITDLEFRILRTDGAVRWVRWRGHVMQDGPNESVRVVGVNMDVTDAKLAEDALRVSEERFATAFRSSPMTVSIMRMSDARFVDVNDTFLQHSGFTRDEVIGRTAVEVGIFDTLADRIPIATTIARPSIEPFELTARTKSGQKTVSLVALAPLVLSDEPHYMAMAVDITHRKQAELRLRTLSQAIEQSPAAITIADASGTIEYVNCRFVEMTGYAAEHVVGKRSGETPGVLEDAVFADVRRALAAGQSWRGESNLVRKNGERYVGQVVVSPVLDLDGSLAHVVAVCEDVTERRALEQAFRQAQKMEAFGQLSAGIAHDFNNLLTVIIGNVELATNYAEPERDASVLAEIGEAARRAATLTRQLLTFSRRQLQKPEHLDLNEVAANMTRMLERLIGEHITIATRFCRSGACVYADNGMLEQIIVNLAVNARDAMPSGGQLEIGTEIVVIDEAGALAEPRARPGTFVRLAVRDTGTGIAPEHMPRIFEPFFTTKEVGRGTGLGLATVFGIVQQHEGWVDVTSTVERGTTFHVHLPYVARPAVVRGMFEPATITSGHMQTILVVEDEAPLRRLLSRVLTKSGYRVLPAGCAEEALQLWKQHAGEIELLMSDIVMPGMSGRDLAKQLVAAKPALGVILLSGYVPDGFAPGDHVLLSKPFQVEELLSVVGAVLDRGKPGLFAST